MPKRFTASAKKLQPDPRYGSKLVAKFVNCLMRGGAKSVTYRVFYGAMDIVAKRVSDEPPLKVFEAAVENVKPLIEVRSRRVGGATYQVPQQVSKNRQQTLAIRWILVAVRSRTGRSMAVRLADELMAAYRKEGTAMTQRENIHRMAEANKAFAHFAW